MGKLRKVKTGELAELVGVSDKQIYKLKYAGVITPEEDGSYPERETIRALFDHYRRGGDDVRARQDEAKLEKIQKETEILDVKAKRLKRELVDFALVKRDWEEIGLTVRNRLLELDVKLARSVLACDSVEVARATIREEIERVLTSLADLDCSKYDAVTREEVETVESVEDVE